jgi:RNA polymerase sigma-70 factor, ECF subfamily
VSPPGSTLTRVVQRDGASGLPGSSEAGLDAETSTWLRTLRADGEERVRAVEQLHGLLLRAARWEAQRRRGLAPVGGVELDDLCQQATDDAVVAVLAKLDDFRGASRFTTWAYKFVLYEVSVKLRRHAWRGRTIPTADDDPTWDRLAHQAGQAEMVVESLDLVRALRRAVVEELTPLQREVFVAVLLNGVPGDVLAARLGSTRGAIYKTVHDARRKLRARLAADGYLEPVGEAWTGAN